MCHYSPKLATTRYVRGQVGRGLVKTLVESIELIEVLIQQKLSGCGFVEFFFV
jgi:hypothetical protein